MTAETHLQGFDFVPFTHYNTIRSVLKSSLTRSFYLYSLAIGQDMVEPMLVSILLVSVRNFYIR